MREFVINPVRSRENVMASLRGNWNYPTTVRFGAGRIAELPDAAKSAGIARPLLVTDPRLAAMAMVGNAVEALGAAGLACAVFSDVRPNPVATSSQIRNTSWRSQSSRTRRR